MGQVLGQAERSTLRLLPIRLLDDQPWKATDVPWVAAVRNSIHAVTFDNQTQDYQRRYPQLLEALKRHKLWRRLDAAPGAALNPCGSGPSTGVAGFGRQPLPASTVIA